MATQQRTDWLAVARTAILAGLTGGLVMELYVYATTILPSHGDVLATWQWIASAAMGPPAYTSPALAWAGLAIHFVVSIGWAGGYAYIAGTRAFMSRRWVLSGLGFGVVVYVFMQFLLIGAGKFQAPSDLQLLNQLVGHGLFFGVPVAFVTAKVGRAA
jgi:uncharacterized membrane protein YagU involved in acid resistance